MATTLDLPLLDYALTLTPAVVGARANITDAQPHPSDPKLIRLTLKDDTSASSLVGAIRAAEDAYAENPPVYLAVDRSTFAANLVSGSVVATLSTTFRNPTFAIVGVAPSALTLSGGKIVATGSATAGQTYTIKVRATSGSGRRAVAETFSFRAK